ncbi:hypothetical protein [Cognatilysobacter terrigena]|uniref:hypothetical protein n=1 Tax=Cognatilysobacter terrigena TaxID=2488749 RepID=UPI00105F9A9B|nr:hypothetical protein [Lysobacter terrigena]
MTARPTEPSHDALSAEERELAARLARLDASAGPSSALDARILAAARSAAAPASTSTSTMRRTRRWPSAVGAAAVLVAAVGLAWQLRPMFQLPPPPIPSEHAGQGKGAGAEADTVVQVETVPRRSAPAMAPAPSEVVAQPVPPAAARKATPAVGGGAPRVEHRAPVATAAHPSSHDFVDEAVPPPPPPAPAAAPEPRAFAAQSAKVAADAAAGNAAPVADAAASRVQRREAVAAASAPLPDVSADARLPTRDWLVRIRARRDAGDVAGARASLARFVIAHPRVAVPADLRPLLRDDDPWSP